MRKLQGAIENTQQEIFRHRSIEINRRFNGLSAELAAFAAKGWTRASNEEML
jgi:hypothetical protein